jgi:hypothetical protein
VRSLTNDPLDEVRELKGIDSDYKLAKLLEVPSADRAQLPLRPFRSSPTRPRFGSPPTKAKRPAVAKVWRDVAKALIRKGGQR